MTIKDGENIKIMKENLFLKELPEREWVKFSAEGFSTPVTGVVYRRGNILPGMPLGGIGTGFISLGTDGTLDYVNTIFNQFEDHAKAAHAAAKAEGIEAIQVKRKHVPTLRLPFLGMAIGERRWVLSLKPVEGTQGVKEIHYWGHYPVAELEYETDAPVSVGLRAWVPFLPGDAIDSNIPGAVFEVHLRNISEVSQSGTIALSFNGPLHLESLNPSEERQLAKDKSFSGVMVTAQKDKGQEMGIDYTLGVVGKREIQAGGSLKDNPTAWKNISNSLPKFGHGVTVEVDFSLAAGETKTLCFVLAWFAPFWKDDEGNAYIHKYYTRFKSSLDVAKFLAQNHTNLLQRILGWQGVIYREEKLPGWLRDSLVNIFAVIAQESFWVKSADPHHWTGEEGFFSVNESLISCPQQSCIACDWIGQWPIDIFFPELSRNNLRVFKHYQKAYGEIPSTWGSGVKLDKRWYDQQISIDSLVYIQLIDRLWQTTKDKGILQEFYPSVKSAVIFMQSVDQDCDGIVDVFSYILPEAGVKANSQYYDVWPMSGAATHVAGFWLATLRIVERMAEKMKDRSFAQRCKDWYKRGSKSLEKKLWNESVGSYLLYHNTTTGEFNDTVLSDQLVGEWSVRIHGLPSIFPEKRIKKVLYTLERLNVSGTSCGIRTSMRPDKSNDETGGRYAPSLTPSYSTLVPASLMIYTKINHFHELGLEIVRRTWYNMVINQQMAWDMPCMLNPDGTYCWGLEYWHNTMLWSFPIVVLGKNLRSFSAPGGFRDRIIKAGLAGKRKG